MAMTLYATNIYSNDGSKLLWNGGIANAVTINVTATGTTFSSGDQFTGSWSFGGDGTFLGLATAPNAQTPTYAVGTTFQTAMSTLNLYAVSSGGGGGGGNSHLKITYGNADIVDMDATEETTKTLACLGKLMENDVAVTITPGGGESISVEALSVTENGTYTAPTGKAYSPVAVDVSSVFEQLPTGYTRLNYIGLGDYTSASNNAYIDIDVKPVTGLLMNETLEYSQNFDQSADHCLFGCADQTSGGQPMSMWTETDKKWLYRFDRYSGTGGWDCGGPDYLMDCPLVSSANSNNPIYVLSGFIGDFDPITHPYYSMPHEIYKVTVTNPDGTTVRYMLPCRQNSSGELGLYDLVSDRFFGITRTGNPSIIYG